MTPRPASYASNGFERQVLPIVPVVVACVVLLASMALAASRESGTPLAVGGVAAFVVVVWASRLRLRGALRVDEEGASWRGALAVARAAVVHVARDGQTVTVRTDSSLRSLQRFHAPDEASAEAMVRALGEADARPAVQLRVGSPASTHGAAPYFTLIAALSPWALAAIFMLLEGGRSPKALAHFVASIVALALVFVPKRVTLGADGMPMLRALASTSRTGCPSSLDTCTRPRAARSPAGESVRRARAPRAPRRATARAAAATRSAAAALRRAPRRAGAPTRCDGVSSPISS